MNRVFLIGNLCKEPEVRQTPTGKMVTSASLATNKTWIDKSGEKQQQVTFHNLVIWEKMGENLAKYQGKGSKIAVEGEIVTRSFQAKDGTKRYVTEILVSNVEFLSSKPADREQGEDYGKEDKEYFDAEPKKDEDFGRDDEIQVENIPF